MPSKLLNRLAQTMRHKKQYVMSPYVLFLGAGASVKSGFPLLTDLASKVLDTKIKTLSANRRQQFDEAWLALSPSERYATFSGAIKQSQGISPRPSQGYIYLAKLVAAGYFNLTITTNADSLLEDSLRFYAGLTARRLKVLIAQENWRDFADRLHAGASDIKKVIKVHGDSESFFFPFTRVETREFPPEVEIELRRILSEDVIIVGNKVQDWDMLRCLSNHGGSIWHVGPDGPSPEIRTVMMHRGCENNIITANFDEFFQELYEMLLPPNVSQLSTWMDSFKEHSLEDIQIVNGYYGLSQSNLILGRSGKQACLQIVHLFPEDLTIEVTFKIVESLTPNDWVGFWARGRTPYFLDGNLVYLRRNGSLEIYSENQKVLANGRIAPDFSEVTVQVVYRGDEVIARCMDTQIRTPGSASSNVIKRDGWLFIYTHRTRASISHIQVLDAHNEQ